MLNLIYEFKHINKFIKYNELNCWYELNKVDIIIFLITNSNIIDYYKQYKQYSPNS